MTSFDPLHKVLSSPSPKSSFEILWAVKAIRAEASTWNQIVEEHYNGNPFLSVEWYTTWLSRFAGNSDVHFVKVSSGDKALGYFPLIRRKRTLRGVTVNELRFAGNVYSPLSSPILVPECASETIAFFYSDVLPRLEWDVFAALEMAPELPGYRELLLEAKLRSLPHRVEPGEGNWIFERNFDDPAQYFKSRRYDVRSNVRKFTPRLEEQGPLSFRLVSDELSQKDVQDYKDVYAKSWKEPEKDSEFHPALMHKTAAKGWLRLGILSVGDLPIAAQLWLFNSGCAYSVKTAYDEKFKRFAPGTILTWKIFERLFAEESLWMFDFLKGDEPYKSTWCDKRRERVNLYIYRRNFRGAYLSFVEFLLAPLVRRLRALFKPSALA